jgi:hypothetical protein
MNKEEYEIKTKELREKHNNKKRKLDLEFAESNQKYQIGDFVKDICSKMIIKIDKIDLYYSWGKDLPEMVYLGEVYTIKGIKSKTRSRETTFADRSILYEFKVKGEQ